MKLSRLSICILCIFLMLVGCSNSSVSNTARNEQIENDAGNQVDKYNHSNISKGIWMSQQLEGGENLFIYINHIDSEYVEGEIYHGKLPVSSYYYYNQSVSETYTWNLKADLTSGINEEKLTYCDSIDNISLKLADNKITANIEMVNRLELNENTFHFSPFTVNDVIVNMRENGTEATILDDYIVNGNIDKWGDVTLMPLMVQGENKHPLLFLTNDNNEILYQFDAPFQNGLDLTELSIDDINGDGLSDITIILGDKDESIGGVVAWVFLQTKDNLFCVDYEVQNELNIEFYDKLHLDVRTIKEYFKTK